MAEMTKEALNKIKAAAFTEFKQGFSEEEFRNLFAGGKNVVTAWRITEGTECKKTFPAGGRLAGRNGALNDKQRSGGRICK